MYLPLLLRCQLLLQLLWVHEGLLQRHVCEICVYLADVCRVFHFGNKWGFVHFEFDLLPIDAIEIWMSSDI